MRKFNLAIDSNVFTYLVEATAPDYTPDKDHTNIKQERISIVRIAFYYSDLVILPAIEGEYQKIRDGIKRENHLQLLVAMLTTYNFEEKRDLMVVMAEELINYHNGYPDRLIYSEAVYSEIDYLISCDKDFISHLSGKNKVIVVSPSELWRILDIPRLSEPVIVPRFDNPLSQKPWWKW